MTWCSDRVMCCRLAALSWRGPTVDPFAWADIVCGDYTPPGAAHPIAPPVPGGQVGLGLTAALLANIVTG